MKSAILPQPGAHRPQAVSSQPRRVEPEILDGLDPSSSEARASRRDLGRINWLMGSEAWFKRSLRRHLRAGETVLEIGAGTGELGTSLRSVAPTIVGLDLIPRPTGWPETARWFEADVLAFSDWAGFPVVIGNLFFHHFDSDGLAKLGRAFNEHVRVIIASEPLRARRTASLFSLLCPLIRAHPVTRHDGRVSINAGFRHDELPQLLQLDPALWRWRVQETGLGASRLVAERRP